MDNDYIVVNKRLAEKLSEFYWDNLLKVEGGNYYFEPLKDIYDMVDLYTINKKIIDDSLSESLEPIDDEIVTVVENIPEQDVNEETIIEPVVADVVIESKPVATKFIKSARVMDRLVNMGFPVIETTINKRTNKPAWIFNATDEFNDAFGEVVTSLPKFKDNVDKPIDNIGVSTLTNDDKKYVSKLLRVRRDELLTMGIESEDVIEQINGIIKKLAFNDVVQK